MANDVTQQRQESPPARVGALIARFATYTATLGGMLALLPHLTLHMDVAIFGEGGAVEWAQFGVLLLAVAGFAFGAARLPRFRQCFLLLALAAAVALVREADSPLNAVLPHVGWKLPATLVVLAAVILIWREPARLGAQMKQFASCRGLPLLWAGLVVAVLFAQLVGHGRFLQLLMKQDYVRDYKRVVEELGELFGYVLVLFGTIESLVQAGALRSLSAAETGAPDGA